MKDAREKERLEKQAADASRKAPAPGAPSSQCSGQAQVPVRRGKRSTTPRGYIDHIFLEERPKKSVPVDTTPNSAMDTDSDLEEDKSGTMPPSMAQPATPTDWSLDSESIRNYLFQLIEHQKLSPKIALQELKKHPHAQVHNSVLSKELHQFYTLLSINRYQEAETTPLPDAQWYIP